jgi:hypothetical protein
MGANLSQNEMLKWDQIKVSIKIPKRDKIRVQKWVFYLG